MKFAIPLSMLPIDEIKPLAIAADQMGYDSLAVSDHLIHPETFSVPYPYTDDGSVRWEPGTDWPDPINTLSLIAGATKNITKNLSQLNMAESNLSQMMPRFNALSEAYPEVKADKHFLDLSNKLVRLEEQLADGREFYNSEATVFNTAIGMLPDTIVASMKGARRRDLIDIPDFMHNDYVMSF